MNWIAHSADGFVAVGQGEPGRWTDQTTLWESSDGLVWEPLAGGPDVNGMYNLQPLGDGLLAQAWRQERSLLFYYDGDEWTEIEIEIADGGGDYYDFSYLATSGDTAMVFATEWNEQGDGPVSRHAWRIGADRVARSVSLPTDIAWNDANIGIAGSEEGFVLAVTHYGAPGTLQVWFTADGDSWREIASTTTIANAAFLWNLQRHEDRYFVVGEAAETTCSADGDGVNCERLVGLWSSPDGADWDRVLTMSGEPVSAFEVGSGPLGLVALAVNFYNESQLPRPLFLSQDGWCGGRPAVGDKTMLIPGSAYNEFSGVDSETPFLIVGRLLEP